MKQDLNPYDLPEEAFDRLIETLLEKDRNSHLGSFVQGLIHNVNGPLQNISMLVEMLTRGHEQTNKLIHPKPDGWELLSDKQSKRLRQISQQIGVLTEMLRDFMTLQEVERNDSEVDINMVLERLIRAFRADLFFKHHVDIELRLAKSLPLARIPGQRLIPALIHLLKNATASLKGSAQKTLEVESLGDSGWIRVVFKDSGCGFGMAGDMEELFKLFSSHWPENVVESERGERHFGIGLFAARRLLEPYGGRVTLERSEGVTIAAVEIPTAASSASARNK